MWNTLKPLEIMQKYDIEVEDIDRKEIMEANISIRKYS